MTKSLITFFGVLPSAMRARIHCAYSAATGKPFIPAPHRAPNSTRRRSGSRPGKYTCTPIYPAIETSSSTQYSHSDVRKSAPQAPVTATAKSPILCLRRARSSRYFWVSSPKFGSLGLRSPASSSSTVTPRFSASAGRTVMSGRPSPVSHLDTALLVRPSRSASICWVSPIALRRSAMNAPIFRLSI